MSDGGFTYSYRSKWQHPIFRNLRDAAVWAWMIDAAAWRETRVRYNEEVVTLQRGQLITSIRFLAKGFECSETVIRRLLDRMESDAMVSTRRTHGGTVITICNYDEYQSPKHTADTPTDTQQTQVEHAADTNKKERKESNYLFVGRVIRLSEVDYGRLKAANGAIPDFDAFLRTLDAEFAATGPPTGKGGWYVPLVRKLQYQHQRFLKERENGRANTSNRKQRLSPDEQKRRDRAAILDVLGPDISGGYGAGAGDGGAEDPGSLEGYPSTA